MRRDDHHLDERALLLSLDRELPAREQRLAEEHLAACAACRGRRTRLLHTSTQVAWHLHEPADDEMLVQRSRARLSAALSAAARHRQPPTARVLAHLRRLAMPAAVGAAVLALVFVSVAHVTDSPRSTVDNSAIHETALPIAALTPGATWTIAADQLCAAADRESREIPAAVREAVLRNYGMTSVSADDYELDYLITPELGGSPDARNLWPQRYASGIWNAHVKDQLEDLLPALVCAGKVPLQTAQHDIAANWIAAYKRYFHTSVPLPKQLTAAATEGRAADHDRTPIWRAIPAAPTLRRVAMSGR
jgi:hypothetical protein